MSPHDILDTPSPELLQTVRAAARMCERIERAERTRRQSEPKPDDRSTGVLDEYRAAVAESGA